MPKKNAEGRIGHRTKGAHHVAPQRLPQNSTYRISSCLWSLVQLSNSSSNERKMKQTCAQRSHMSRETSLSTFFDKSDDLVTSFASTTSSSTSGPCSSSLYYKWIQPLRSVLLVAILMKSRYQVILISRYMGAMVDQMDVATSCCGIQNWRSAIWRVFDIWTGKKEGCRTYQ